MPAFGKLRTAGLVLLALLAAVPAEAQESESVTNLDPLQKIIDSFGAGESAGDLVGPGQPGSETAITAHLQFVFNHGADKTFGEEGWVFAPTGVAPGEGLELVSLAEYFDGGLEARDWFPPLDPWAAQGETLDITTLAEGWSTYGDEGPIDGPVLLTEVPSVVWGIELADPYPTSCDSPFYIGRSWQGTSVGAEPDPAFTTDALANRFGDTHDALADGETRVLQLSCLPGGDPFVEGLRMTDDRGIRPFSPTKTVALVKGARILFFTPMRILDGDLDPSFYATPPAGGPIVRSQTSGDIAALLPNPYADFPLELDLSEPPEGEALGLAPPNPAGQTLLLPRGEGRGLPASPACPHDYLRSRLRLEERSLGSPDNFFIWLFSPDASTVATGQMSPDGSIDASRVTPEGTTQTLTLDGNGQGTVDSNTLQGAPCTVTVHADPAQIGGLIVAAGGEVPGQDTETPPATAGPEGTDAPGTATAAPDTAVDAGPGTTAATGNGGGGGVGLIVLVAVIVILLLLLLYWFFALRPKRSGAGRRVGGTRERGGGLPSTTGGDRYGSTPRDDDEGHGGCDWAVYVDVGGGRRVPVRRATGHECCRYVVGIETTIEDDDLALQGRQDGTDPGGAAASPDERRRLPNGGWLRSGLDVWAGAAAVSGPTDRQDWMQGLGDPRPPEDKFPEPKDGSLPQARTLEEPLDVAAYLRHVEKTSIWCVLESECPGHVNTYQVTGGSLPKARGTQECTNTAYDPQCPVEIATPARVKVTASTDLVFEAEAVAGADPDEIERGAPSFPTPTDAHDHATRDRDTFLVEARADQDRQKVQDAVTVDIRTEAEIQAGTIVPVGVWPTTERVVAHSDAWSETWVVINADMKRTTCTQGDCCGHGPCRCDPSFRLEVSVGIGSVTAEGDGKSIVRRAESGPWEAL